MKKMNYITIVIVFILLPQITFGEEINQLVANLVKFNVIINGDRVRLDDDIVTINDKTYIPLREISEILGNNVEWDDDTKTITIESQTDTRELFPFQSGKLYGYIDRYGKVVIEPQFEYAGDFSEGLACVGKEKDQDLGMVYGYINTTGNLAIPYINNRECDFHNGMAAAWEYGSDTKAYVMNKKGENILSKYYYDVRNFSNNYAAVLLNDTAVNPHRPSAKEPQKWTFINTNGEECGTIYDAVTSFVDGVSVVEKDGETYAIDTSFEPVFNSKYILVSYNGNNRYIAKNQDKYGVIDGQDNIIIDFNYDNIYYSDDMYIIVIPNMSMGLVNKYGEVILEPDADRRISSFAGGMAVIDNNKVINKQGNVILDASEYDVVAPYGENILYAHKEENDTEYEGYIDKYGNVLVMNEIKMPYDE